MSEQKTVAIVGAGPAGLYAAKQLAGEGVQVVLINRDIKPGGLAEYGIFFDKYKMKNGLRNQFRQIMETPNIAYFGNVVIGRNGDVTLDDLQNAGFDAILVTVGAQGTKWLGLPGEDLTGVYHAKDLVYHYNSLPPFSEESYPIGQRVAVIGAGNVMLDMAHWLVRYLKIEEMIAIVRRDPSAVKFTKKEMQLVAANLDLAALDAEIERTRAVMEAVGVDVAAARDFILSALPRADEAVSDTRFRFAFLSQPKQILGDEAGRVCGLEVEDTTLKLRDDGSTSARGLGTTRVLDVDSVIFAIGDRVDDAFGLPIVWNEFAKNPNPRFPQDGMSYEAYDPEAEAALEGVFVAGWAREASTGLVGAARKDGITGAKAVTDYLATTAPTDANAIDTFERLVAERELKVVRKADVAHLEAVEARIAEEKQLEEYKFSDNDAMLAAIDGA
jgi:ferredoxin--NADP+ reductase